MEIRAVVAEVVGRFDFGFGGEGTGRGERVLRDMRDEFTAGAGRLELVFWERGSKGERG